MTRDRNDLCRVGKSICSLGLGRVTENRLPNICFTTVKCGNLEAKNETSAVRNTLAKIRSFINALSQKLSRNLKILSEF